MSPKIHRTPAHRCKTGKLLVTFAKSSKKGPLRGPFLFGKSVKFGNCDNLWGLLCVYLQGCSYAFNWWSLWHVAGSRFI